ncbi:MAG: hypothetical protein Q9220_002238 [cf. Caloplaca sp. 1 TL-2023]
MSETDPVPTYTATAENGDLTATLRDLSDGTHPAIQQDVISSFFAAIEQRQSEVVAMMIESGSVTANTLDPIGRTPLIAATAAGNVRMVQELVDFDADVDAFGKWKGSDRTPLMLAAGSGNLTLTKLLVDVFHADDALIAPDGQMALRLAVEGGWKEIVNFLPTRRGGGWRRWKTHHALAVRRIEKAIRGIYWFSKIFIWEIPKFLIWTAPKHLIFRPLKESAEWCWTYRKHFGPWCKKKIQGLPRWCKETAVDIAKWTREFIMETLPRIIKKLLKYGRSLVIVRIPAAARLLAQYLYQGIKTLIQTLLSSIQRGLSFLHNLTTALLTFFRQVTLKDVWNGLYVLLHAVFVGFPSKLWSWVRQFGALSLKIMEKLGDVIGEVIWWIGSILADAVFYVPKRVWVIVAGLAGSVAKGYREVVVWIDPKR